VKGISYVKQRDGGANSSTDEEEVVAVVDAVSDADEVDEDASNKSENRPESPKMKAASSAVKKKREVVSLLHFCITK